MAKLHHEHHSLRSKFPLLIAGAVLAIGFAIYQLNSLVHADDITVSAVIETVLAITAPDKLDLPATRSLCPPLQTIPLLRTPTAPIVSTPLLALFLVLPLFPATLGAGILLALPLIQVALTTNLLLFLVLALPIT